MAMGGQLSDGLRVLCRELGLGACGYDLETDDAVRAERLERAMARERLGDLGPEVVEPLPTVLSGVDLDKRLSDLDETERRRLCAYHVRRFGGAGEEPIRAGDAVMCSPTRTRRWLGYRECLAAFPRCDAPVREAEACVRATTTDVCGEPDDGGACQLEDACQVGVSTSR